MSQERHQLGVGHRLKQPPSKAMGAAMNSELRYAAHIAQGLSYADIAHVIMLTEQCIIPRPTATLLLTALLELHETNFAEWTSDLTEGDLYDHRDAWLRQRLGTTSGWLHTARARREAINLGWLIGLKGGLLSLQDSLVELLDSTTRLCSRHQDTLMPDFTYLQHAHPTTLGHYLLGFVYPFERDTQRLARLLPDLDACPAGSVSTNGTRLPVNRERMRELLGFQTLIPHNRDAMWQTDLPIALMSVLVSIQTTIDRLAEELLIWSTTEFGFVELSDAHCRTSVIMPQKKNPYALAHLRGRARSMIGQLVTVITTNQTPTGQVDNRTATYEILPQALQETQASVLLLREILDQSTFHTHRLAAMASEGAGWATEVAEFLIESEQVDARSAHSLVGRLTANLPHSPSCDTLVQRLRHDFESTFGRPCDAPLTALNALFDPLQIVTARTTPGSCGHQPMVNMLTELGDSIEAHKTRCRRPNAVFNLHLLDLARQLASHSSPSS